MSIAASHVHKYCTCVFLHAVIRCSDVEELENGDFSYDNESRGVNTVVTYVCDSGFYLDGISMRTCTVDRTWVPSPAPTCGELLYRDFCWCCVVM